MFDNKILKVPELHQAEVATYLLDAVIGIAFFVLILIIANVINWKPTPDPSPAQRKRWFIVLAFVCLFTNLGVNYWVWMTRIDKAQFVSEYTIHMIVAAVVSTLIYCVTTFIVSKTQKKDTKIASIFNHK